MDPAIQQAKVQKTSTDLNIMHLKPGNSIKTAIRTISDSCQVNSPYPLGYCFSVTSLLD